MHRLACTALKALDALCCLQRRCARSIKRYCCKTKVGLRGAHYCCARTRDRHWQLCCCRFATVACTPVTYLGAQAVSSHAVQGFGRDHVSRGAVDLAKHWIVGWTVKSLLGPPHTCATFTDTQFAHDSAQHNALAPASHGCFPQSERPSLAWCCSAMWLEEIPAWLRRPLAGVRFCYDSCKERKLYALQAGTYKPGSPEQLLHLAAVVNANSHGVGAADVRNTDVGIGLFPALAMLNHSCRPNCCFTVAGPCKLQPCKMPVSAMGSCADCSMHPCHARCLMS